MVKLPIVVPLMEDELLYSYLSRLAIINCFENLKRFTGNYVFSDKYENKSKKHVDVSYDIRDDLYFFASSLTGLKQNQTLPLYTHTSLFYGIAPLMLRSQSSHYIGLLSKYQNHSRILSHAELMVQTLNYCEECKREDLSRLGFFYYRRGHQMPGVTVCYLHGCALTKYRGRIGKEFFEDQPGELLPTFKKSFEYAVFCKDFLDAKLECDRNALADVLKDKIERTKKNLDLNIYQNWKKGYDELSKESPATIMKYIRQKGMVHPASLLTLLLYWFGTVSELKTNLCTEPSIKKTFVEEIENKYLMLSDWREDIVELQCMTCGTLFLSTPSRILSGWGCPVCDGKIDDHLLFQRLFDRVSKGEYELLSNFDGMGNLIHIKHYRCNNSYWIQAKRFLEQNVKCKCSYLQQESEIGKTLMNLGFELRAFHADSQTVTLCHSVCGSIFTKGYRFFLNKPQCPSCNKQNKYIKKQETFAKKVRDLVGNEYTVLEDYVSYKVPVSIRHNKCSTVQKYAPKHFFTGARCKICHRKISRKAFTEIVSQVSFGKYLLQITHVKNTMQQSAIPKL